MSAANTTVICNSQLQKLNTTELDKKQDIILKHAKEAHLGMSFKITPFSPS